MNIIKIKHKAARAFLVAAAIGVCFVGATPVFADTIGEGDNSYNDTDLVTQSDINASNVNTTEANIVNNDDNTVQADNVSCKKYTLNWTVTDHNGNPYDLNQDRYGNGNSCVTNSGGGANFTVTKGGGYTNPGGVGSYPNLIRGCWDSGCNNANSWPKQVSSISNWYEDGNVYTNGAFGIWNASLDLWFNRTDNIGPSRGAEILIDLDRTRGRPTSFSRHLTNVTVDGASYDIYLYRQTIGPRTWNFLHFWRNTPVTSISGLNLTDFMAKAETINCTTSGYIQCLQPSWYWTGSDTGFEIWNGGYNSSNTNTGLTWGGVSVHT